MISGRLDEELSPDKHNRQPDQPLLLLLFNESFAATNEREGSEIGRHFARALLEAHIRVFFVTHQFDFADSFPPLSTQKPYLCSSERHDSPTGRRTFKLDRRRATPYQLRAGHLQPPRRMAGRSVSAWPRPGSG